jgi:transposase
MFLRRYERKKNGKGHVYWALVESIRTARGSRQKVVAYLGDVKRRERTGWADLGRRLDRKDRPDPSLFDPPAHPEPADDLELVKIKGIRLERPRDFGDVWMALGLWRLLKLDELLASRMESGDEDVPWPTVAAILTIGRFCEPSSELHIADTWYRRTALEDLLGVAFEQVHHRRLYEGLDALLPHKAAIESHLKQRLGDLFDLKYDLLLYDVTSTYFEGQCQGNPMAKRGYSRDHRPDCLQVCIGLVVTPEGIPIGYEVFDGNRNDATTVEEIVKTIEAKHGRAGRVWVMDRGMVSESNLKFLRDRGGSYVVGTPKAMLRQFERHLTDQNWTEVCEGVEVKRVPGPEGDETFVLARSADRREKEKAIHDRFFTRMEAGLTQLRASAERGRLTDLGLAHERLGRLRERYWRAASAFKVRIASIPQPAGKARLKITWSRDERWRQWAKASQGCYLLRTNLADVDPATLWKCYIQLTEAEWAFRITKDELEIRPIWHQKAERVQAHILVCFLAYVLWKTLARWMKASGLGDAPRTLLAELTKIKSGDVVLPTVTRSGQPGRTVRVRCVTTPDKAQKVLLNRLGLRLPQHLRYLEEVAQM